MRHRQKLRLTAPNTAVRLERVEALKTVQCGGGSPKSLRHERGLAGNIPTPPLLSIFLPPKSSVTSLYTCRHPTSLQVSPRPIYPLPCIDGPDPNTLTVAVPCAGVYYVTELSRPARASAGPTQRHPSRFRFGPGQVDSKSIPSPFRVLVSALAFPDPESTRKRRPRCGPALAGGTRRPPLADRT